MRVLFWIGSALLAAWALLDPRFRNAEGIPTGAICLPFSLAAAGVVLGLAWRTPWRKSVLWFALALTGQAVGLQMIDAGTRLHYQHYRAITWILAYQPWHLLFVFVQTIVVALGFRGRCAAVRHWLRDHFRWWQLAGIAAVFWLTAATVSEQVRRYVVELIFAGFLQAVSLGNVVLLGWSIPEHQLSAMRERLSRWLDPPASVSPIRDPVVLGAAVWVTLVAAFLSVVSYERHPHIPDEVAYVIQARYFSEGRLTLPAPPVPEAFDVDLMDLDGGRWFSPVPPGWPAILAVGMALGVPWLVNPLVAGLNTFLAAVVIRKLYDPGLARRCVLLLAASPWHVLMGMNLMTHTAALTCALAVALGMLWAQQGAAVRGGLLSGTATGLAALIRPLEGFTLGVLGGTWILVKTIRQAVRLPALVAYAAAGLLAGGATLYYNQLLTGDPLKFPIMAYTDKRYGLNSNALGFGPDRGLGWPIDPNPGHSPLDALINANLNTFSINIELFGWSTGSLLLVAVFLFAGRFRSGDWWMLALCTAIFTVHFFYYFSGGPDFGARYWFLMLIPCVVCAVRGLDLLWQGLGPRNGARATAATGALALMALVNYFPWRAVDKYHHYQAMRPDVRCLSEKYNFSRSLVLVRGDRHPDYASAAVYNPLDLRAAAPVYAWDRSAEVRRRVVEAYRDRPVWIVEGPTLTGEGFRVKAGPLQATDVLATDGTP